MMKKCQIIASLLVALMFFATACSKKAVEAESSAEQQATQASQTQPEPLDAESKLEPESSAIDDQAMAQAEAAQTMFLNAHIFFEFDSAMLGSEAQKVLNQKAQWLFENPDVKAVLIEGHCDERGTDAYNMALGAKRASVVKEFLLNLGVDAGRLETQSYGEEKPLVMGNDEAAYSKNRRASFVIN
jgi:peptidoglycan-associated lipoprotein